MGGAKFWKSTQDAVNRLVGPDAFIDGSAINSGLVADVYTPVHNSNKVSYCKGASLLTSGTSGLLAVHLVNDPAGVWYLIDLVKGAGVFQCEFDLVGSSAKGTTVTLDGKLYIYPASYTFASNVGQEM